MKSCKTSWRHSSAKWIVSGLVLLLGNFSPVAFATSPPPTFEPGTSCSPGEVWDCSGQTCAPKKWIGPPDQVCDNGTNGNPDFVSCADTVSEFESEKEFCNAQEGESPPNEEDNEEDELYRQLFHRTVKEAKEGCGNPNIGDGGCVTNCECNELSDGTPSAMSCVSPFPPILKNDELCDNF